MFDGQACEGKEVGDAALLEREVPEGQVGQGGEVGCVGVVEMEA